ncbi:TonB-dependent receptor [Kaistella sp. DKR-2]|uniref:TonB-dependent receptor n=1 Tax=Kaistella soli TaxID=2849654 RepID=UPI001C25E03C|nr:TonB-dependent receptor [Kaistella soli]MBU8883571.1 TonB-dependent receptor [Kaistella soli]
MNFKPLKKSMLTVVITLSTASVYYAQTAKDTVSREKDIEQVVLTGVADIAKDRKTPVAVSTIKEAQIVERLGNQEFPEILKSTPSIYATKGGGGFGDGRVNIRGFDTSNTAVMINGVPVNDMEGGTVYWSNWAGLSDVTSAMQVQRGLGSSKLAIASVGGTINVLTRAADKKKEGNVTLGLGNDGYLKTLFSYNTGKSDKGWATSFLMSRTAGNTYVDGSQFEAYNYYFALGYKPNEKHDFQFTFTGAPQWHMQNFQSTIETLQKYGSADKPNRRYNSNWGYLNGEEMSQSVNYYSKPVMSLNWDWTMSEKSKLSSVLYGSWGRGGGTGVLGSINGTSINSLPKTADGLIRFDDIVSWNQGNAVVWNPSVAPGTGINKVNATPGIATRTNGLVKRAHVNSHDWYGFLTNFQHKINQNWNFSAGLDGRYYYGYHPGIITDFWGNSQYRETNDNNQKPYYTVTQAYNAVPSANPFAAAIKDKTQIASRNYDGEVMWLGAFGQVEYSNDNLSAFLQGSFSEQGFQRIDNWIVDGVTKQQGQVVNTKTGFKYLSGYNAKGGVNYNIDENHNVFVNAGYYSKQPLNYAVYPNSQQVLNPNLKNEKIGSAELGYGFRNSKFRGNLNLYYTSWKDRFTRITGLQMKDQAGVDTRNIYANIEGVTEIHMGAELELNYKPLDILEFTGMFSMGDWHYKGNAQGSLFDENNNAFTPQDGASSRTLYVDKIKVSDAAQTTASLGFTVTPVKAFKVFGNWNYYDKYFAVFDITKASSANSKGALELPSYNLFDAGLSYTFSLNNNQKLVLTGNVYNLLDTYYISDGKSSIFEGDSNAKGITYKGIDIANQVYFGFGRTWSASLSYRF